MCEEQDTYGVLCALCAWLHGAVDGQDAFDGRVAQRFEQRALVLCTQLQLHRSRGILERDKGKLLGNFARGEHPAAQHHAFAHMAGVQVAAAVRPRLGGPLRRGLQRMHVFLAQRHRSVQGAHGPHGPPESERGLHGLRKQPTTRAWRGPSAVALPAAQAASRVTCD